MFSSLKLKLLLGLYVFILLSIPVGAYLASQHQSTKSSAQENTSKPTAKPTLKPASTPKSPAKELLSASETNLNKTSPSPSPSSEASSPTIASSFGPTLSLKAALEGRSTDQSTKLFVGILEGSITQNPKFLLSFTINLPKDGTYSNLSLAGLTSGNRYTAILKGSSQIATASAFTMSPTVTTLNSGAVINMLSGDLNEDNVINSQDYSIARSALNSTPASKNWNANADLNKDKVINLFDLAIINKNIGQAGATGAWTSPIPKVSTPSASLDNPLPIGGPGGSSSGHQQAVTSGYWIWVPQ